MSTILVNLGCGGRPQADMINCDLTPGPGVECVFDLQQPWPFVESSVHEATASHVLEHLADPFAFFRYAWHALEPNGRLYLRLPYGNSRAAWWDLTHLRPWFAECFACLQPGYDTTIGNPQHQICQETPWCVMLVRLRLGPTFARWMRWRWLRTLGMHLVHWLHDTIDEMYVELRPLKSAEEVHKTQERRHPASVPIQCVVYKHHLEHRERAVDEPLVLIAIGAGQAIAGWY